MNIAKLAFDFDDRFKDVFTNNVKTVNSISVEKDVSESVDYMNANGTEINEALKKSVDALNEAQNGLAAVSNAIQQEYANRQQAASANQ